MKITVLSDTHDNIWSLEKALQVIKQEKCEAIIHCGDFCAPFMSKLLISLNIPVNACFGNNDEDQAGLVELSAGKIKFFPLYDEYGEVEIADKKIAFCHYPKLGELLAKSGQYDAVFHGHTHESYQRQEGKTLLANPGSVCGIVHARLGPASFGIYDTNENNFSIINL